MLLIEPVRQVYDWGSPSAIPRLFGLPEDGLPWAELWLGAHPLAPSPLVEERGAGLALDRAIGLDPVGALGSRPAGQNTELGFLLKILGVGRPLSLQVHPSRPQAEAGFAREEAAGVPREAPRRTYRDAGAKPEMLMALTPFSALAGFRPAAVVRAALTDLSSDLARAMASWLDGADPHRVTMSRLLLDPGASPGQVAGLVEDCRAALAQGRGDRAAYAAVVALARHYPGDPGVAVSLLLNHVVLAPGEAVFVPTGTVHCYLDGVGVEVMASSDNVIRAGLTSKPVDAEALIGCVEWDRIGLAPVDQSGAPGARLLTPPISAFGLVDVRSAGQQPIPVLGPRIAIVLEGELTLRGPDAAVRLGPGEAAFLADRDGPVTAYGDGRAVIGYGGKCQSSVSA